VERSGGSALGAVTVTHDDGQQEFPTKEQRQLITDANPGSSTIYNATASGFGGRC
jgi:hypothetical protein